MEGLRPADNPENRNQLVFGDSRAETERPVDIRKFSLDWLEKQVRVHFPATENLPERNVYIDIRPAPNTLSET